MANKVKITVKKKVKDMGQDEKSTWRRKYLSRKTERKTERNNRVRQHLSNLRRTLRQSIEENDETKATDTMKQLQSALDKAAKTGVLHKRTAARRKSRLTKKIVAMKAAA